MQKLTKHILMAVTLASVAVAQTSAPKTAAKPAPATSTQAPAAKSATTKAAPTAAKPTASATKPAAKPAATAKPKAAKPMAAKEPMAKPAAKAAARYSSRRDPFINPVKMRTERLAGPSCTTGSRCLVADQVVLKGVVKTQQGMIAMVENSTKKQYNLREKDPIYNGFVLKITGDSVVFKESTTDNSGRPVTREVVKRVTVPVV
ncbi:MAG TPA: hypothetical protein VMZ25_01715 [Terriglobales bacterium]|nr:hypothetical protein [Terriglobales bacterium]